MTRRLIAPIAVLAVVLTCASWADPPPSAALNILKPVCSLAGDASTLAGKLCSAGSHAGRLLSAGKKLLTGHVSGALESLAGDGASTAAKSVGAVATLAAFSAAVIAGAKFAMHETASLISSTTRPELQSTWFSAAYWRVAGISALLTLPFLFAAAIQALLRSELALLWRAAFGYLPLGLLAVAIAAPVTMLLLSGSDEMSRLVSSASGGADADFLIKAGAGAGGLSLISRSPFIAFMVGLLTVGATVTLWGELLVRSAAVYVIVLMLPLFFAAMVWPARRIWAARAVELLIALVLSKFAIVAVLSLGGAALGHTLVPSFTSMLAGATLILLAAFSPWALLRMLPLHELAAGAAAGLRSEAGQQLALATAGGADYPAAPREPDWNWAEREDHPAAEATVHRLSSNGSARHDGNDGATNSSIPCGDDDGAGSGASAPSPAHAPTDGRAPSAGPASADGSRPAGVPADTGPGGQRAERERVAGIPATGPDGTWSAHLGAQAADGPPRLLDDRLRSPSVQTSPPDPGEDQDPRPAPQEPDGGAL
jgi:hypothetical protein